MVSISWQGSCFIAGILRAIVRNSLHRVYTRPSQMIYVRSFYRNGLLGFAKILPRFLKNFLGEKLSERRGRRERAKPLTLACGHALWDTLGVPSECEAVSREGQAAGVQRFNSARSFIRSRGSTGFTMWWSKPASCERRRSSSWPQPVTAMRRDLAAQGCSRMRRQAS
jgi:hypothetical protein